MEKLNKEKKTITIASVKILKQGVKEGVDYEGNPTRREGTMLKIETNNGTKLTSFDTDFLNLIGKKVNVGVGKNPFEYTDKRTGEVKTGYGGNCELDKTSPIAEQKTLISKPELEDTSKILDALANIRKEIKEGFNEVLNEILNQNNGNN